MARSLPKRAPVVVIGGGIIGVSALYHLASRNLDGCVLLERKQLASGTTWHAAGIVGQLRDSSSQTEMGRYTARLFQELEVETGQATGYKQNGTMHLALSDVRLEQLLRSHDHALRLGMESQLLNNDQMIEIWPWVNYEDVKGGFLIPSNGQVNPLDVTLALSRGAKQKGSLVFENTEAYKIITTESGKVKGVETSAGYIETEQVVLAGGMWTYDFAKQHGVTVPLHAAEHWYIVTESGTNIPRTLPVLVVQEERTYWKEDAGKLLIGGFEAKGKAWATKGIPADFEFDELPFDIDHVEPELNAIFERMPALAEMGIQTFFNGPESFTPDGRPYIGPAHEMPGLLVAAGMNSNGILNSGGVGFTIAEWIVDGMPKRSMASMLSVRAHPFQRNKKYNIERVKESIGLHWGTHWPGRQMETARGVRRVPLHKELEVAGAVFSERIGWETPSYFDKENSTWPTEPSLDWQEWSTSVEQECIAARDAVVLLDQSMYSKIIVQGPDAGIAINNVCGASVDVPIGTSVYTQFLNHQGGIEADVTITRLKRHKFLILTGHPSQMRDQHWLLSGNSEALSFEIFDATSAYSLITLHGPKSRELLSSMSSSDLSNEAFPFGAAQEIDVHYARCWAVRRSFLGELGFELLIPTEFTASVYEEVLAKGASLGLKHMGMFAMNACRIEKGFRHFGHDISEEDTPFEAGLGFSVDLNKTESFPGRKRLEQQKAAGAGTLQYRLVSISSNEIKREQGPYFIHNEPILRNGEMVGHITSGAWGFRLDKMVGLAYLHHREGVKKEWIESGTFEALVAGVKININAQFGPLYDPKGELMRA